MKSRCALTSSKTDGACLRGETVAAAVEMPRRKERPSLARRVASGPPASPREEIGFPSLDPAQIFFLLKKGPYAARQTPAGKAVASA